MHVDVQLKKTVLVISHVNHFFEFGWLFVRWHIFVTFIWVGAFCEWCILWGTFLRRCMFVRLCLWCGVCLGVSLMYYIFARCYIFVMCIFFEVVCISEGAVCEVLYFFVCFCFWLMTRLMITVRSIITNLLSSCRLNANPGLIPGNQRPRDYVGTGRPACGRQKSCDWNVICISLASRSARRVHLAWPGARWPCDLCRHVSSGKTCILSITTLLDVSQVSNLVSISVTTCFWFGNSWLKVILKQLKLLLFFIMHRKYEITLNIVIVIYYFFSCIFLFSGPG